MRGENRNIIPISEDELLYDETKFNGRKIVRIKYSDTLDLSDKTELIDLNIDPKINMKGDSTRILFFSDKDYDIRTYGVVDGMDLNVSRYFDAIAGDRYVYLGYSGREPRYVYEEGLKGIYYMYLEQWDWNGNPLKRYKLDQFGFITIDEKNGKIYLVTNNHEHPFFVYDLPEL